MAASEFPPAAQLREMSVADLNEKLLDLRRGQFKMRLVQAAGQLSEHHLLRSHRRAIARIKTVLAQKAGG